MNRNAAAVVVAACAAVGAAIAAVVACIPDLPSDPVATGFCGDGIIDLEAETCDPGPGAGDAAIPGCNAKCEMECPSGAPPWPVNNHCYQRVAFSARTFQQATASCKGGSHIATFASESEFQQALPLIDTRPFWVGLDTAPDRYNSVVLFEPGWSPNCPGCYAHTTTPEASLRLSDAAAEGSPEDCITGVSDPEQSWTQYPCTGSGYRVLDVICELEPVGRQSVPCEAGICIDLVKSHPIKRYVYQAKQETADNAKQSCAALGGRLVVLQSRDEREQLWHELSRLTAPPSALWIGLSQVSAGGPHVPPVWAWDDSTPAEGPDAYPSVWGDHQPVQPSTIVPATTLTTRAFLWHQQPPGIDETLARNDQAVTELPFVCEITAATLAAARDR